MSCWCGHGVRACGICGPDLHAKDHADELTDVMTEIGYHDFMRSDTPVIMRHKFCGEIAERGGKTAKAFKVGTTVVSFPLVRTRLRAPCTCWPTARSMPPHWSPVRSDSTMWLRRSRRGATPTRTPKSSSIPAAGHGTDRR